MCISKLMKHINVFKTTAAYTAVANKLSTPQLSYIKDTDSVVVLSEVGGDDDTELVDLGLSVKWAKYNVGATHTNDSSTSWYGNYYAWGEIEVKTSYTDATYKFYKNGNDHDITKYNGKSEFGTVDNKAVLEAEDDIATVAESLRLPTKAEYDELFDTTKVNNEWVTNYNGISGLNGRLFTSLLNNNTIFFPASGDYFGAQVYGDGFGGYAWAATRNAKTGDQSYAYYLQIGITDKFVSSGVRSTGRPARGVR